MFFQPRCSITHLTFSSPIPTHVSSHPFPILHIPTLLSPRQSISLPSTPTNLFLIHIPHRRCVYYASSFWRFSLFASFVGYVILTLRCVFLCFTVFPSASPFFGVFCPRFAVSPSSLHGFPSPFTVFLFYPLRPLSSPSPLF